VKACLASRAAGLLACQSPEASRSRGITISDLVNDVTGKTVFQDQLQHVLRKLMVFFKFEGKDRSQKKER